jgi:hypothetical protein
MWHISEWDERNLNTDETKVVSFPGAAFVKSRLRCPCMQQYKLHIKVWAKSQGRETIVETVAQNFGRHTDGRTY